MSGSTVVTREHIRRMPFLSYVVKESAYRQGLGEATPPL